MADVNNSQLLNIQPGILQKDACVVIVRTEWNSSIIDELERGCRKVLDEQGVTDVRVINVPGAFEVSFAIQKYFADNREKVDNPDAFIALACIIRGDTPHFDYVCQSITSGLTQLNIALPVPTIFGVLTVDDQQQAEERIGGKHGHKGEEAAITALKMIALSRSFK